MSTLTGPCIDCPNGRTAACRFGMKVREGPDRILVVSPRPFLDGLTLSEYENYLAKLGVPVEQVVWTGLVKCADKYKVGIKHCTPWIWWEIDRYKPIIVITIGDDPLKKIWGGGGVIKSVGRVESRVLGDHRFHLLHLAEPNLLQRMPSLASEVQKAGVAIREILAGAYVRADLSNKDYKVTTDHREITAIFERSAVIALDIETGGKDEYGRATGIDPWHPSSRLLGISISDRTDFARYVPHIVGNDALIRLIGNLAQGKRLILHNGKFDLNFLRVKFGFDLFPHVYADTMLAHHLLHEWKKGHGLKALIAEYIPRMSQYEDVIDHWFKSQRVKDDDRDYADLPFDLLWPYGCADADGTFQLWETFERELQQLGLVDFLLHHVMSVQWAYANMERQGWTIDQDYYRQFREKVLHDLNEVGKKLEKEWCWGAFAKWLEWKQRTQGKAFWSDPLQDVFLDSTCAAAPDRHPSPKGKFKHGDGQRVQRWTYTLEDITPDPTSEDMRATVLYNPDFFGLPVLRTTDKVGSPRTDEASLRDYQNHADERVRNYVKLTLEHAHLTKLWQTYVQPVFDYDKKNKRERGWVRADGRIHAEYLIAGQDYGAYFDEGGTVTGRTSCKNPNLQNQPSRGEGKQQKKMFVAGRNHLALVEWPARFPSLTKEQWDYLQAEPWSLISNDYKGLELRVLADFSGESFMLDAFARGFDLHTKLGAQIFSEFDRAVTYEWMIERLDNEDHPEHRRAKDYRDTAKTLWFAVMYGAQAEKLCEQLARRGIKVTPAQMKRFIDALYANLPSVRAAQQYVHMQGLTIQSMWGRRRTVHEIYSTDGRAVAHAQRQRFNFVIQSTGSDIAFAGTNAVHRWLRSRPDLLAYEVGTVHDSLIIAAPNREVPEVALTAKHLMENVALPWTPKVQYAVDVEVGPSWGAVVQLEKWLKQQKEQPC